MDNAPTVFNCNSSFNSDPNAPENNNPFYGVNISYNHTHRNFTISKIRALDVESTSRTPRVKLNSSITVTREIGEAHDMTELLALVRDMNNEMDRVMNAVRDYIL